MASIPIKFDGLRVGLFVKLECLKWDNPFSEKKFKITSPAEILLIKEIPNVKLFFDPELSDPDPEVVQSVYEEIVCCDSPITDEASDPFQPEQLSPVQSLQVDRSSKAAAVFIDQSQAPGLEWEEVPDYETPLPTRSLPITENWPHVESLPANQEALKQVFPVFQNQEQALELDEVPNATICAESVNISEAEKSLPLEPLEVGQVPRNPFWTVFKDHKRTSKSEEVEEQAIPEAAISAPSKIDQDFSSDLIDDLQRPRDPDPAIVSGCERDPEPEEVCEPPIPVAALISPKTDQGSPPEWIEDHQKPVGKNLVVELKGKGDPESEEVGEQAIPEAAISSHQTEQDSSPDRVDDHQKSGDPNPVVESGGKGDPEPEVIPDQLMLSSDDLSSTKREERQKAKSQVCQIQPLDIEQAAYLYHHVCWQTKMALKRIFDGETIGIKIADRVVEDLQKALGKRETVAALIDLFGSNDADDPIFTHSFNVCMISMLIGQEFDFEPAEISALGLGALLHDVGKPPSPENFFHHGQTGSKKMNPEWLTHCQNGKEKVAHIEGLPLASIDIIHQHHERLDGTGFPQGLREQEISFLAKIVMVADEYDHLCHQSNSSNNLSPSQALSHLFYQEVAAPKKRKVGGLEQRLMGQEPIWGPSSSMDLDFHPNVPEETGTGLSGNIIISLVKALGVYPPGSIVELTDGTLGRVTGVNFEKRTRPPIMLCLPDIPQAEAKICDLAEEENLHIVKSIPLQHLAPKMREYLYAERLV